MTRKSTTRRGARIAAFALLSCLAWSCSAVAASGLLETWEASMRDSRPHLPALETRSAKTIEAANRKVNLPAFGESQDVARRTLGAAYDEASSWKTVFASDEERLDVSCSTTAEGVTSRFAAYSQLGSWVPYYWTVSGLQGEDGQAIDAFLRKNCLFGEKSRMAAADGVLSAEDVEIFEKSSPVEIPYARFRFAFIDDAPGANWAHPCRYVFISEDFSSFTIMYRKWRPSLSQKADGASILLVDANPDANAVPETLEAVQKRVYDYARNLESSANALDYRTGDKYRSYFVLISGGATPRSNGIRFWSDSAMLYATLTKKYGIPKDHIRVYISDGNSTGKDANLGNDYYPTMVDSPKDLDGDGVGDITGAANKANIRSCFNELHNTLTKNDQLFVFMSSHGSSDGVESPFNYDCYICLFGEDDLRDDELSNMTKDFPCPVAVAIECCYAGGFVDDICRTSNRAITTACHHYEVSWGWGGGGAWVEGKPGKTGAYNCWAGPLNTALRGYRPKIVQSSGYPWEDGYVDSADLNGDNLVSFAEAAAFAEKHDGSKEEHPQYRTTDGVGESFFILNGYPFETESKSVALRAAGTMVNQCPILGRGESWRLGSAAPAWIKSCEIVDANGGAKQLSPDSTVSVSGPQFLRIVADEITSLSEERSCTLAIHSDTSSQDDYVITVKQSVTYEVTYAPGSMGSGQVQSDEKVHGAALTLRGVVFTRAGYTQTGWSTVDGGEMDYDLAGSYVENAAVTLYPFWTANTYSVKFSANGGTGTMSEFQVTYDTSANLPSNKFTKVGCTFVGWATSANGDVEYDDGAEVINLTEMQGGTFTLYAKWRTVPTYSVSYRHGENGVGSRQTVSKSENVPLVLRGAIFKRNGYEQTGWTTVDGGAKEYDLGATYSDDASVTLYPSWVANTYTVKFDSNGGTGTMSDLAMTYDVAVSLPENAFAKSGSRFAGWAKTASGSVTYGNCASVKNLTTVNDGTVVLYAKWLTGSSGSSAGSGSGGSAGGGSSGGGSAGGSGASGGSSGSGSGGSGSGSGSGASGSGASGGASSGGTPSSGSYISSCGWHGAAPMSVALAWTAKKAATLNGALYGSDCNVAGVVQLKVAKPTTKKGVTTAKVSGYVMLMDGKRKSVKSVKVEVPNGGPITVAATVKDLGTLTATIGDDGFTGTVGGYSVQTASVGGSWTKSGAAVAVDFAGGSALPDGTIAELLPNGEPVLAKGGKWAFEKSASVKLKNGALVGTDDPKKPNLSAMKLAYAPKTGIFKGSFKIYAVQGGKLKNFSVKVNGFVVEGTGCGRATLTKPQSSWSVSVE